MNLARHCLPVEELPGRVIDVCVWGASRPHLFRRTIESFRSHAHFSTGQLRFFLDDGAFDEARAAESAELARSLAFDGVNVERVGSYGFAMTGAMNRWVRAPLLFSLEDDMLCKRDVDLDLAFDLFTENPGLNQLCFNRRKNFSNPNEEPFVERTLTAGGKSYPCQSSKHWYFGPALWRMSFIRPRWRGFKDNVHHALNAELTRGVTGTTDKPPPAWYADVLGALTLGPPKEAPYFDHIGARDSVHEKQGRV